MSVMLLYGMMACTHADRESCRIHGVVENPQLNGKQIFLVPLENSSAEAVDSVYIQDGKFEFVTDTCHMAQIIMDYHFRDGVQRLLVITEPGDINVTIGEVSSSSGTPGNDSLEVWKKATEKHQREMGTFRRAAKEMEKTDKAWLYPGNFGWFDIDTWDTLFRMIERKDREGNALNTINSLLREDKDNLVITENKKKIYAIKGLKDYLVIDTEDALLICPREDKQFKDFISGLGMPGYEDFR